MGGKGEIGRRGGNERKRINGPEGGELGLEGRGTWGESGTDEEEGKAKV